MILFFSFFWAIAGCLAIYWRLNQFNKKAIETTGTILSIEEKQEGDSDGNIKIVYKARISFNTLTGNTVIENVLPNNENYYVGGSIILYYDPENVNKNVLANRHPTNIILYVSIGFFLASLVAFYFNQVEIIHAAKEMDFVFCTLLAFSVLELGSIFLLMRQLSKNEAV